MPTIPQSIPAISEPNAGYRGSVVVGWALFGAVLVSLPFVPTIRGIAALWSASDTFAHGWFVLPLAFWLGWLRRHEVGERLSWRPDYRWLLVVVAGGGVWLLGRTAGVQVVEQLGFVCLLIGALALVLGRDLARRFRFALVILLFLAPVGAELVPVLMELTADLTVWAIRLTGIPIYRDGLYFSIPSGNWSVVEACSGIRYLIASFLLGSVYAGLYIEGTYARLLFLLLSLIVPIAANAVRAFGIVMLGHLSSNRLATGADHLIYGWVFFGIVMFCLFAIGARFPQRPGDGRVGERVDVPDDGPDERAGSVHAIPRRRLPTALAVTLLASAAFPAWAFMIDRTSRGKAAGLPAEGWLPGASAAESFARASTRTPATDWSPSYRGFDREQTATLGISDAPVSAYAFVYAEQYQGKELISSSNRLLASDDDGRISSTTRIERGDLPVSESLITTGGRRLLVWRWYHIGDRDVASDIRGKLLELQARLTLRATPSIGYVLAVDANVDDARQRLGDAAAAIAASR